MNEFIKFIDQNIEVWEERRKAIKESLINANKEEEDDIAESLIIANISIETLKILKEEYIKKQNEKESK